MAFDPSTAVEFDPSSAVGVTKGFDPSSASEVAPTAAPQPAKPVSQPSIFTRAVGGITEPLATIGTGMIAKPISDIAGIGAIFADYLGIKKNDPTAVKRSVEEAMTYQPRTAGGQAVVQNVLAPIGGVIETGAQKLAGAVTDNPIAQAGVKEAALQGLGFVGVKNAPVVSRGAKAVVADTAADIAKSKAFTQQAATQAASSADWERAAIIEAAKVARKNDIVMNPATVNPNRANNVRAAATGGSEVFDTAASIANKPRWNKMAREEMGLGKDVPLDESAYKLALTKVAKPYDDVANIGTITSMSDDALKAIREIDVPDILPAGEQAGGKVKRITDSIAEKIESGEMSGANMLKTIKDLRTEISSTREAIKSGTRQVTNVERDAMHAKSRLIDELEKITSENIADPKWRQGFNESRRKMAQIYALRDATDLATFQIDPMVFAAEMARPNFLTGAAKEMGQIAANAPGIANINAKSGYVMKMPSRSGPAGTAGYAFGAGTGLGAVPMSAAAAVIGAVGGKRYAKGLMTPEAQARLTTPIDRRKPLPGMMTGENQ